VYPIVSIARKPLESNSSAFSRIKNYRSALVVTGCFYLLYLIIPRRENTLAALVNRPGAIIEKAIK